MAFKFQMLMGFHFVSPSCHQPITRFMWTNFPTRPIINMLLGLCPLVWEGCLHVWFMQCMVSVPTSVWHRKPRIPLMVGYLRKNIIFHLSLLFILFFFHLFFISFQNFGSKHTFSHENKNTAICDKWKLDVSPKKRVYARLRGIGYRELCLDKRRKVESQWAAPAWFVEETIKMMVDKLLQNLNLFPTALPQSHSKHVTHNQETRLSNCCHLSFSTRHWSILNIK